MMKTAEMKVTVRRFIFLDSWINHTSEQTYLVKAFSFQRNAHLKTNNTSLLKYAHTTSGFLSGLLVLGHFPFLS